MLELSTDQLKRLAVDGSIRVFEDHGEDFTQIIAKDLDVSLSDLAAGKAARTSEGIEIRY